jgi:hypothetical protein
LVFKNSKDGSGISVIDESCAIGNSQCVCTHVKKFYSGFPFCSDPPIFWIFDSTSLPVTCQFNQCPSITGDPCHHNVKGLNDTQAKKIFKKASPDQFFSCDPQNNTMLFNLEPPTAS